MTVAGIPSVVDSPSVHSARIVAGFPVVIGFLLWFAFLLVLASLQLLAFPAVAGDPVTVIASFPAVAVVSTVPVFSAFVGAPAESLSRFSALPEN